MMTSQSSMRATVSPSSQRAWIEIICVVRYICLTAVALLAEGVDRNRVVMRPVAFALPSPSSQRAWIEITSSTKAKTPSGVALLAEGVDRNIAPEELTLRTLVALLAEGVDRNTLEPVPWARTTVALLAEGVDRNSHCRTLERVQRLSPSSQRAWIEIQPHALAVIKR